MTTEHAHLSLQRTGGLAGVPVKATLETSELDPSEAAEMLSALDRVDLDQLKAREDWPAGAADTFQYTLEVRRGDATQTASFTDRQVPPELAPVIRALVHRSRPAPGR